MKRAILFDFGGTLDWPAHWLDRFLAHYRAASFELDRVTLDRAFSAATQSAYRTAYRMRDFNLEATIRYLVSYQLASLREADDRLRDTIDAIGAEVMESTISASFAAESRAGLAASRTVLEGLTERFHVGIVSNFYGNLDRILDEAGLLTLISFVADSSRLRIFKPDPGIFTAALDGMGAYPASTLMVGDSLSKDCAPARALGMRAVWLRHRIPGPDADAHSGGTADFTIEALAELEHLKWMEG
ncbi:MAG TPA: HAD family hydrolase [Candidatus Binataceae bacterium]|nr:HAD family hydrolase [Candidatus Binataceae bacterium]